MLDFLAEAQAQTQLNNQEHEIQEVIKNVEKVAGQAGSVNVSLYALVGWVVIVTLALVAIAFVTFRRWRSNYSPDGLSRSSDSNSSGSLSDITGSSMGSTMDVSQASTSGLNNGGFEDEAPVDIRIADTASPSVHAPHRPAGVTKL